jgi:hypothetical protein
VKSPRCEIILLTSSPSKIDIKLPLPTIHWSTLETAALVTVDLFGESVRIDPSVGLIFIRQGYNHSLLI